MHFLDVDIFYDHIECLFFKIALNLICLNHFCFVYFDLILPKPLLGLDMKSAECQRFIKEGMTISYNKILLDDAVSTWKFEIHVG